MEIYDSIHGIIVIDDFIKKIIDTEEFQRLRNIKQLGYCYFVFPGASHNRFEHSIGVYHLTKEYICHLNKENEYINHYEKKILLISALIHDLGHGPFSHLFDDIVNKKKNHEYRSIELFRYMNQKYNFGYCEDDITFIYEIIKPTKDKHLKKYLYQIVSNKNGIDVDRFDYLMRDIKMIGLNYGIEYDRIMKKSKIMKNSEGQMEIVYSDKIKTHIENFFQTRFIMYKEIYNHHTVRAIEYMMKEIFQKMNIIYDIQGIIESDNWEKFIELTDSIIDLIYFLPLNPKTSHLLSMIQKIKKRDIYKSIGEIITDKYIDIHYPSDNIIIDNIKIFYYGDETCKYYQEKNKINLIPTKINKDEYSIRIYYRNKNNKQEAKNLFRQISQ